MHKNPQGRAAMSPKPWAPLLAQSHITLLAVDFSKNCTLRTIMINYD